MFRLYIANRNYSSWSLRPWILMKELGIPFEEQLVLFGSGAQANSFKSFSPTGCVPCLVDGDLIVWDSLAITEYIAEFFPAVWPQERSARAWARCASAEMHAGFQRIRNICTMNCGLRIKLHESLPELLAEWNRIDTLWSEGLIRFGGPFLTGKQFCAVDAFYAPIAFRIQTYAPELSRISAQYAEHLLNLEPMHDWYRAAIAEPWRDEAHEAEARAAGVWVEDYRAAST